MALVKRILQSNKYDSLEKFSEGVLSMNLPKKELLKVLLKRYLERAEGDGVLPWDFFRSPKTLGRAHLQRWVCMEHLSMQRGTQDVK